ncbi:HD domain-containing protein [Candidatus Micrarchaeota archaeon]|nr:HD domain-containing protein [Candidatus Micrarchaeota archaeon]
MKKFVEELETGNPVDSLFSVKYKRAVVQYANGWRFSFGAADKTGELEVSFWGGQKQGSVQAVHDSFKEGDVVRVQGFVSTYKDRKKIDVNEGKGSVTPTRDFDLSDFLPVSNKNVDELYSRLLELVDGVKHDGLRALLDAFFKDDGFAKEFKHAPAAMFLHHAWLGGLLEHSLAVALTAREAAKNYDVDLDLLTAGALLHDVGKIREFEVTTSIKVGEEGMLRGHTVIGEELVREKARAVGLDAHTLMKLSHMILAHHGEHENGAPKEPMFVEAILVYYADEMDAKASQFERIKKDTTSEDFRVYDKHWGEVYLK